jgi:hypothetical protein
MKTQNSKGLALSLDEKREGRVITLDQSQNSLDQRCIYPARYPRRAVSSRRPGFLELQVRGGFAHLFFQRLDDGKATRHNSKSIGVCPAPHPPSRWRWFHVPTGTHILTGLKDALQNNIGSCPCAWSRGRRGCPAGAMVSLEEQAERQNHLRSNHAGRRLGTSWRAVQGRQLQDIGKARRVEIQTPAIQRGWVWRTAHATPYGVAPHLSVLRLPQYAPQSCRFVQLKVRRGFAPVFSGAAITRMGLWPLPCPHSSTG